MKSNSFGKLQSLRERPIPNQRSARHRKRGYRGHALDLAGLKSREPLIRAREFGIQGENFYAASHNPPHYGPVEGAISELWLRATVGELLAGANEWLAEAGLGLWLFDAWRPTKVQSFFHDKWIPTAVNPGRPGASEQELRKLVRMYWAAPSDDPLSPSPHLTGGAVDITLCWADTKERLWMGSLFDDVNPVAHLDHFERPAPQSISITREEARANRRLLYWILTEAGLCANPNEWWHFCYGDQMWARLSGAEAAFYGAVSPPGHNRAE